VRSDDTPLRGVDTPLPVRGLCDFSEDTPLRDVWEARTCRCVARRGTPLRVIAASSRAVH
jgi:hypothetical protein